MHDNRTHSVPDRIVSVHQPLSVLSYERKPVKFGEKLDISVVDGWTRLECYSFDTCNEAENLKAMAERFREREEHYPARILADKIYRNQDNLTYMASVFPVLLWDVLRKVTREKRFRTIKTNANVWKWSTDSVWQSVNAAWDWSLQSCRRRLPMCLPCLFWC